MKSQIIENIFKKILKEADEAPVSRPLPLLNRLIPAEELSKKIAARVEAAKAANFALCRAIDTNYNKLFVIYKAGELINDLLFALSKEKNIDRGNVYSALSSAATKNVIGMIEISKPREYGPCNDAYVVDLSAAKDGYGPMLYDIAMSLTDGKPIMSDRKAVSTMAAKLYKGLQRRKDVEAVKFVSRQNVNDPNSCVLWSDTWPERDFLDYSYKRASSIDTNEFEIHHEMVVASLNAALKPTLDQHNINLEDALSSLLKDAGYNYFDVVYNNVSPKDKGFKSRYKEFAPEYKFRESVEKVIFKKLLKYSR